MKGSGWRGSVWSIPPALWGQERPFSFSVCLSQSQGGHWGVKDHLHSQRPHSNQKMTLNSTVNIRNSTQRQLQQRLHSDFAWTFLSAASSLAYIPSPWHRHPGGYRVFSCLCYYHSNNFSSTWKAGSPAALCAENAKGVHYRFALQHICNPPPFSRTSRWGSLKLRCWQPVTHNECKDKKEARDSIKGYFVDYQFLKDF